MPAYFVKQPNGRIARYSSIPDGFTHMNMTRDSAIAVAQSKGYSESEAISAVERGIADMVALYDEGEPRREDGLTRWHACMAVIQRRDVTEYNEALELGSKFYPVLV
jgi:hypothetical protein